MAINKIKEFHNLESDKVLFCQSEQLFQSSRATRPQVSVHLEAAPQHLLIRESLKDHDKKLAAEVPFLLDKIGRNVFQSIFYAFMERLHKIKDRPP